MGRNVVFTAAVIFLSLWSFSCQTSSSAALSAGNEPEAAKAPNQDAAKNTGQPTPVLVELFTSEGCSSCPPADRALMFLEKEQPVSGAQIVALELHVDYWDRPAWKDPFSSAVFTERQTLYAKKFQSGQIYTPQMVVDGSSQFIGSDLQTANIMIVQLAKYAKANVQISQDGEKLKIKIDSLPKIKDATVFLALAENNLDTNIKGGENSGKKLFHSAVARELRPLGSINADSKDFETETGLGLQKTWKIKDLKAVVFVQENESRTVLGVGQLSLTEK